ncbi:MAG TPA: peptidoglycan DD-metalloendopeptidase family protein [Chitinophagales bacterium]|nr:peptidoglycan DD-metalloendopeptidase family protein [Chitinophagales bacterium]MBP6154163.1 peptidoglycan DD-metalloendopeptidase family protein [Chitinophagales bacterium]HQV77241.1 peptidoglycan DD-metalloendopeptidase family protein [Chitinophagales bacterium]HQW79740.1 peptidoglycan DD-metalloendopeptidase family protein [Chitinophagales bacterium]HRB68029.1 peptidoglycan DD-metalloendopeptidase family protein [Chitinophagales bacterium]
MKNNSNILFPFSNKKLAAASKPSILLYFNAISVILFSNKRFFLCVCLCIGSLTFSFSQDKKAALEAKKQKLLKEIEYTQQQLEKTKASKNASLADVQALSKQVELRKKLITEIETEVNDYSEKINENIDALRTEETHLDALKKEYADAVVRIYKSQRFTNKLLFILNANSFSEAIRRLNYLRKYANFREQQATQIVEKKSDISSIISSIDEKKKSKENLLNNKVKEKQQLDVTVKQKNAAVQTLKQKEKQLQTNIAIKQKAAAKLDAQIEAIIKKEIELARLAEEKKQKEAIAKATAEAAAKKKAAELAIKKAKEQGKEPSKEDIEAVKKAEIPIKITSTPEYDKLSSGFMNNKGKLPWPVEKGFVSKGFGPYTIAETNIKMQNNGIDIRTDANSSVRCVFEGSVVGILNNPTFKNAVIVSHGNYFTVYSKLASVNVSKGQKVSTKQVIGAAYTDEDNITEIHLEVWKGAAKLDPETWIYAK